MVSRNRLISVALLPGLLLAGAAAVSAQDEPAGPTIVVGAADAPDVRAALRFPVGWRLEASADTSRRQVHSLSLDERCEVATRRSELPDLTADVDDFVVSLGPGSGFILMGRETVELVAGTAERVDFASDDGGRWSVYVVPDAGYMHELWCRGDELPDDRWRPIAETFDIDPEATLTSSPFDPVVARPDARVAMAFDEGWQVRASSTNQGLLYATSESAVCSLSDYSELAGKNGWATVNDMHDEYVAIADDRDNLNLEEAAYLELPGGRTGLADITFADGTRAIRYSFASPGEDTFLALFCVGDPTPDDRYRSLAESLVWTPSPGG
jgi:hypothetical protein